MLAKTFTLRFQSKIEIRGINPCVLISPGQATRLRKDWRKPMPVRVQINGKPDTPWRINLMPCGNGGFWLHLAETVRKESDTKVGDIVNIRVQFDEAYRGGPAHPMPPRFLERLQRNRKAQAGWDRLSPSRQKDILRYFAALKSPEAQARNVQRAIHVLAGGKARFMARDWNGEHGVRK